MKFSSGADIEAPIDKVFEMVSDFPSFERSARRRGAEVRRTDTMRTPGIGMTWTASVDIQGRRRDLVLTLVSLDPPTGLALEVTSSGLAGLFAVELLAVSRTRTRLAVQLDVTPQTLSARLLIQPLKLAKPSLDKTFALRVAEYARKMEERHQRTA